MDVFLRRLEKTMLMFRISGEMTQRYSNIQVRYTTMK